MIAAGLLSRVTKKWHGASTEHRQIAGGLLAVAAFALAGRVAGAAKEVAVAWRYGVGAEVDAYLFVFSLVTLPVSIWLSMLTVVLIPLEVRLRAEPDGAGRHFRGELLGATIVLGLALSAAAWLGLPPLLRSERVGLAPNIEAAALAMVPALGLLPLLGVLTSLYSIWLMSAGRHWNTLLEGLPALGVLVAVLLAGGVEPLVWGTLAGTIAQLVSVGAAEMRHGGLSLPRFGLRAPAWAPFRQAFGIVAAAQAILSVTTVVDQFYAAQLGVGAISSVGYATRVLALLLGIGATAITRATMPVFSHSHASGSAALPAVARRWTGLVALGGLALVVVGWPLARLGIALLFERGTFTADDTRLVAHLFRIGLLQLPFYFASLVLVSYHSSRGHYGVIFATGVVGLATKLIGNTLLVPIYGVSGLMLSAAAMYAANTLLLLRIRRA